MTLKFIVKKDINKTIFVLEGSDQIKQLPITKEDIQYIKEIIVFKSFPAFDNISKYPLISVLFLVVNKRIAKVPQLRSIVLLFSLNSNIVFYYAVSVCVNGGKVTTKVAENLTSSLSAAFTSKFEINT